MAHPSLTPGPWPWCACLCPGSVARTHLFGLVDTAHVLVGQSRAAEGLLGVLAVTLEDFGLQIRTDWVNLVPPANKNRGH